MERQVGCQGAVMRRAAVKGRVRKGRRAWLVGEAQAAQAEAAVAVAMQARVAVGADL